MEKPLAKMKVAARMKKPLPGMNKNAEFKEEALYLSSFHPPPLLSVALRNLTMAFSARMLYWTEGK